MDVDWKEEHAKYGAKVKELNTRYKAGEITDEEYEVRFDAALTELYSLLEPFDPVEELEEWLEEFDEAERFAGIDCSNPLDDEYRVYHVKNKKVIALAGIDQTKYKAWRDVPGYCLNNGLDYAALYDASTTEAMQKV